MLQEGSSPASLSAFIAEHHLPLVGAYDGKLNERYAKTEKALCIVFYYVEWNFDHREGKVVVRCRCCCCCRPHSTNVLPAESSTRNHVAASSLSPQVARKGSTLSGFVQRSRLEREVGRDLHSNKWEEV